MRALKDAAVPFDEDAFQAYYRDRGLHRTRVALAVGMVLVLALCVIDVIFTPGRYAIVSIPWRMFMMFVPMGVALLITQVESQRHNVTLSITIAALLSGLGSIGTGFITSDFDYPTIMWGNIFFTFYTYLVLGLPFRCSIIAAAPILVISVTLGLLFGAPAEQLAPGALYLLVSNIVGMYSCYRLERIARTLYRNTQELRLFAQVDGLTGLNNRRMFDHFLDIVWAQSRREHKHIGLLLIDIDAFKPYNDHYGHPAGDQCLREVATVIRESVRRPLDFVSRYGGEEFAVVLYAPTQGYLEMFAENLRTMIADLQVPHAQSPVADVVTASIGVGLFASDGPLTLKEALGTTDAALYKAKQTGRNRVVLTVWGPKGELAPVVAKAS